MQTPTGSPRTIKKGTMLYTVTHSPRANANKSRQDTIIESPQLPSFPTIPNTNAGRVKLFKELSSTNHKLANDKLSFKNLSSSLADIRAGADTKESTPTSQSPKKGSRANASPVQEYFAQSPKLRIPLGDDSPKKTGKQKLEQANVAGNKARNVKAPTSLQETRSLSPNPSFTALALGDEIRGDYELNSNPFNLKRKEVKASTYKFVQHTVPDKSPLITSDNYSQYHSNKAVSLGTTMRGDFKAWTSSYVKHEGAKPNLNVDNGKFFGKSNYNSEYLDFQARAVIERSPHHMTVLPELPFGGKSSYRDNYSDTQEPREFVSRWFHKKAKSPFPGAIDVPAVTTYGVNYRPFKVGNGTGEQKKDSDTLSTESFYNQYQSTYGKDFDAKSDSCPARSFIENNAPPKMKNIKV